MKIEIRQEPLPPIVGAVIELTRNEAHDLHTIASMPSDILRVALLHANSRLGGSPVNTYDVYGLVKRLAEGLKPAAGYR